MSTRAEANIHGFAQLQMLRQQGQRAEAREVRRELIRRNIGIAKVAGWKYQTIFGITDARLVAYRLLVAAIDAFNLDSGRPFHKFATRMVHRQLRRLWRHQREREAAQVETCIPRMNAAELAGLLDALDPFQKNIVARHFGLSSRQQQTCAEIGRQLSLPGDLVRRHLRRAIQQLREFSQDDHRCKYAWDPRKEIER